MQELLGRIARLDPNASLGLRVIACFDELMVGNVNTHALLAAASSLAGCVAGFDQTSPARALRVDPTGHVVVEPNEVQRTTVDAAEGLRVWLERSGDPLPNDAIILERLALAVRLRHSEGRSERDTQRSLAVLLDQERAEAERLSAAAALRLATGRRHRVAVAPLFAVWRHHPHGPEDVISTRFGPIHALVVPEEFADLDAAPCGVGVAAPLHDLHRSFRTALVALRLTTTAEPLLHADTYAGLVELLADSGDDAAIADADTFATAADQPWVVETVDVLLRTQTVRAAARDLGIHHSTLQARLESLTATLGFDPTEGYGRIRLGIAFLVHRLRTSKVLELPPPRGEASDRPAQ